MDITPILHTVYAMTIRGLVGCITGDWTYGAAIAYTFFVTREYTQAECCQIKRFGDGHRHKVPWWDDFDPHAQGAASLMDLMVPVVTCAGLYGCMLIFS